MGKCSCCMLTGVAVGMALGMIILPQLDRKTQRTVKRAGNRVLDMAEDTFSGMRYMR